MQIKFKISHMPSLLKETFHEWLDDDPFDLSAVVAYYSIFSLPALLIIIITIAGSLFGRDAVQGRIAFEVSKLISVEAGKSIQEMISNAYTNNNSTIATVIGVATLLFGATGVFMALQKSLNKVWEVKTNPKGGFKKLLKDRATSFGIVLAIGFLMLISLLITTTLAALSSWLTQMLPSVMLYLFFIINFAISFLTISALFAIMYKFLPDVDIQWRTVGVGAALTAFLFVLGKFGLAIYFGNSDPASTYGAAGSLILILLWVFYSCLILFFGAEFTQVFAKRYNHPFRPSRHAAWERDFYQENFKWGLKHEKNKQ